MGSSPESVSVCGVIFRPSSPLQIRNAGRDAGGLDAVSACREIVFSEMYFGLDDGEFVVEVVESVVLTAVSLDFGGGIPVVEVGNGVTECVVGGSGAVKERVEPSGNWLGDVLG
jgi:hypothetical protein